jgi:hypothetical protein
MNLSNIDFHIRLVTGLQASLVLDVFDTNPAEMNGALGLVGHAVNRVCSIVPHES